MRKIFIKYNPYKVDTTVEIEGNPIKPNSSLNFGERRLQEWIEDLPIILVKECNTREFHITFHGTILDYEDLVSVANSPEVKSQGIKITSDHIPAKEVKDKEAAIDEIFAEIQDGPFAELKQADVKRAFEIAKTSDFPVNVVATMSAGKSTLINAMLCQKLMPAKQEACTATITEIRDSDNDYFRAKVYDSHGTLIKSIPELTLDVMSGLNDDPSVSRIEAIGNIPFVSSDDVSLVLVDTPGPNNSRDPEHRAATYRMLSESSKTVVLYILNATQLAVNDDNDLLNHVADSMKVHGRQSKDRFIFVVNKLDDFKAGEDSVENAIKKVEAYLRDKGIENPNIYPASALTALQIRTILEGVDPNSIDLNSDDISEDVENAFFAMRKLNRNAQLHLEQYAPLTPSVRGEIDTLLATAKASGDKKTEALIHSGIVPIESAIRMYVNKYAKTAKIKGIVDTFSAKLENQKSFERTRQEIATNEERRQEILAQIDTINQKLRTGKTAKEYMRDIDTKAKSFDASVNSTANDIIKKAQSKISEQIDSARGKKLSIKDAEALAQSFSIQADRIQADVQVKLEGAITRFIEDSSTDLLENYRKRIADLADDISGISFTVNPMELVGDEINALGNLSVMISDITKTEKVQTVHEWVANTNKKWYKPWTWFQEKGHWHNEYKDVTYVLGEEFADRFFAPIQENIYRNKSSAVEYTKEQVKLLKDKFRSSFAEIDKLLEKKLAELSACADDQKSVEESIRESTERLNWLASIQERIEAILEI